MRKFLYSVLAVLFLSGVAYARSIPSGVDTKAGPEVELQGVYNNSSGTLAVGSVVIWDIDQATGANDSYVNTTTTADTYIVAGVVYPNAIAAGASGQIAVRGVVSTLVQASGGLNLVDGPACSSTTAAKAHSCSATEAANFGFVTQVVSGGSALVCVHCNN